MAQTQGQCTCSLVFNHTVSTYLSPGVHWWVKEVWCSLIFMDILWLMSFTRVRIYFLNCKCEMQSWIRWTINRWLEEECAMTNVFISREFRELSYGSRGTSTGPWFSVCWGFKWKVLFLGKLQMAIKEIKGSHESLYCHAIRATSRMAWFIGSHGLRCLCVCVIVCEGVLCDKATLVSGFACLPLRMHFITYCDRLYQQW